MMAARGARQTETLVPTAVGDLGATIPVPAGAAGPLPGVVVVESSGDQDRFHRGDGLLELLADVGSVIPQRSQGDHRRGRLWTYDRLNHRARRRR